MKFIVATLLTILLSFLGGVYLPWWSVAIAGFVIAVLVRQRSWYSFFSGFLGVFLIWLAISAWVSYKNDGVLASRMASVLPAGGSTLLLMLLTGFIGGLIGGMGALTGSYLRSTSTR
jgi:hypothetical protein